jgi:hypothetical protein
MRFGCRNGGKIAAAEKIRMFFLTNEAISLDFLYADMSCQRPLFSGAQRQRHGFSVPL